VKVHSENINFNMEKERESLYVTKPFLPPLKEFMPSLEQIWDSRVLTNNGPFLQRFEKELCLYLGVPYITVVVNGTSALDIAIKCLGIGGEVITTPYSFIATSQALLWNNIKPVFVDIDPFSCNIDPVKIEQSITKKTTAILPVHVYGNPCKIEIIQDIAEKYKLKVLYDAAHAFGVKYKGRGITSFGDLSILSFHATKAFNTFEGGAVIAHDSETKRKLDAFRDFGYDCNEEVNQLGINFKMNEFQAALGILQLKYIDEIIERLKKLHSIYTDGLHGIPGLSTFKPADETAWNYSYFPVFINEGIFGYSRDMIMARLKNIGVHCRRYFFPIIPSYNIFKEYSFKNYDLRTAVRISDEVICLPIYPDLKEEDISKIINSIRQK
jgi:dTDP-4-amino-4,6-dideoxygalactose transaminase